MIIEANKSQDQQLENSRPKGPSVVSVLILRPEYQESWWCKFQSKFLHAQDPRGASVSVHIQRPEKTSVLAQEEFLLTQPFLFRSSVDGMRRAHITDGHLLYAVYQFKCYSHPETFLQHTQNITKYLNAPWPRHVDNSHLIIMSSFLSGLCFCF